MNSRRSSDAGVMIVQEAFGFVNRQHVRSEAEEFRRGFGVQGKGAASPFIPCLSLSKRFLLLFLFLPFFGCGSVFLAHGLSAHLDAMGVVDQAVKDAVGDGGIADLLVPARDRQL